MSTNEARISATVTCTCNQHSLSISSIQSPDVCDNLFWLPTSLFLWFLLHAALSRAAFFLSQMSLLLFPFLITVIALCPCIFKFVSQAIRIPLIQHVSGWLCSVYPCSVYGRCECVKHTNGNIPGFCTPGRRFLGWRIYTTTYECANTHSLQSMDMNI